MGKCEYSKGRYTPYSGNTNNVWAVNTNGNVNTPNANNSSGVRPAL